MNDITCVAFVCTANVRTDEQQREALGGDGDIRSVQVSVLSGHTHLSSKMAQITCDIRENGRMSKAKSMTHCSPWSAGHLICTIHIFNYEVTLL